MDDRFFGEHEFEPEPESSEHAGTHPGDGASPATAGEAAAARDEPIGGSVETPAAELLPQMHRRRQRRGLAIFAGAALAVVCLALIVGRRSSATAHAKAANPPVRGRIDQPATATTTPTPSTGLNEVVDSMRGPLAVSNRPATPDASDSVYLLGPTGRDRAHAAPDDDIAAAVAAGHPDSARVRTAPATPNAISGAGPTPVGAPSSTGAIDTAEAHRLARERTAYAAMEERAGRSVDPRVDTVAKARAAEESRLRGQPMRWAMNTDVGEKPGTGRGTPPPTADDALIALAGFDRNDGNRAALQTGKIDVPPGTRATAVLTSEFVSDAGGAGAVEARLTSPLLARDVEVLPAGTRAIGSASATPPVAGRAASVSITFTAFETPAGETIKTGLVGKVIDPETLALSITGSVDRHLTTQILSGLASTGVELALSSAEQPPAHSVLEAPTVQEQAIAQAGEQTGRIIQAPLGPGAFTMPTVRLAKGTAITIAFGL